MEKEQKYNLIKTENQPGKEQPSEKIFVGNYWECMDKFHGLSEYSFSNHKKFSYTEYEIKEVQND